MTGAGVGGGAPPATVEIKSCRAKKSPAKTKSGHQQTRNSKVSHLDRICNVNLKYPMQMMMIVVTAPWRSRLRWLLRQNAASRATNPTCSSSSSRPPSKKWLADSIQISRFGSATRE